MMLRVGHEFAHFKILSKLGEGGMGEVYLAEDLKLHRKVAIKVLSSEWFEDADQLERFRREARTAAQISNAYVVPIHDLGSATDPERNTEFNYIVMEYVDGRSLSDYAKEERLDLSHKVRLCEKMSAGLAAAHKLKIVHRDIKPDNILVDEAGDPKILDFGLAKPLEPIQYSQGSDGTQSMTDELTKVGKIMGTVSYMSPEQVKGDTIDTRSDIFSFGILMYRLISGDLPFAGPTQVETMAKILESNYEPISAKVEGIHPELERIINKCLQKDPNERYQDTRDLVVDLRNIRKQFDSGVSDSVTLTAADKPRTSVLGLTVRAMAVVVIVAFTIYFINKLFITDDGISASRGLQAGTNSLAILGFENKTGDSELDWLETGLPEILLTDLSQSQEIQVVSRQRILDCLPSEKKFDHTHAECVEAARSIGTGRLLAGSFFRLGENKLRIDARLEEVATGNIIMSEKVVGEDPLLLVDSLTAKIATALGLGKMAGEVVYASSTEAYKQYHLGMEYFWQYERDQAIDKFHEAIAIDSTFALPYMRIGMIKTFQGKGAEAIPYFNMATQYRDRLPVKDRSMLDAYVDTWVNRQFDQALTKIETILRNYPDDAEIRTFYALFINVFNHDSTGALAQLDTVIMTYPNYPFALEQMAQLHYSYEDYDKALEYSDKLIKVLPDALSPQLRKVRIYRRTDRRDEAMVLCQELVEQFPDEEDPLDLLLSLSIHARDFDQARTYLEKRKALKPDDPYHLMGCDVDLANLANWEGKFDENLAVWYEILDQAKAVNDSAQVQGIYLRIAFYHRAYGEFAKMLLVAEEGHGWAKDFGKVAYPMLLVSADPANDSIARPIMNDAVNEIKAMVPQNFWKTIDDLYELYSANAASDTSGHIRALENLIDSSGQAGTDNIRNLGILMVKHGDYQKGIDRLSRFTKGEFETADGWLYPISHYYVGVANHELGNHQAAVANFEEVLRFWGKPDRELKEIKDARERLAQLTS